MSTNNLPKLPPLNSIKNNKSNISPNSTSSPNEVTMLSSPIYLLTLFIFICCLGFIFFYFLSESFRVGRTLKYMKIYQNYLTLSSIKPSQLKDEKLADFMVNSSYNSAHSGHQMLDYVSLEMVQENLKSGARYLEFSIFNSDYGNESYPIVSNGYEKGEWKMTANSIKFDDVCQVIKENAFVYNNNLGGVSNPDDPLFIGLNLNTNYNYATLNSLAESLIKYFKNRLLPPKYSRDKRNIGELPLKDLLGKVIIFSNNGYQGSKLEEFINANWEGKNLQRLTSSEVEEKIGLIDWNKKKLTIVVPHKEGDWWSRNYDPSSAWKKGCQFVSQNFQIVDTNMDKIITKFKNKSFALKPPSLRN